MCWEIEFYSGVDEQVLALPVKLQARMLRLLELMEKNGVNLGPPHTEAMGEGLFEVRAKAQEGIGRGFFCYLKGKRICVLHVFVKKSQKTPKVELEIARERQKEVQKS